MKPLPRSMTPQRIIKDSCSGHHLKGRFKISHLKSLNIKERHMLTFNRFDSPILKANHPNL